MTYTTTVTMTATPAAGAGAETLHLKGALEERERILLGTLRTSPLFQEEEKREIGEGAKIIEAGAPLPGYAYLLIHAVNPAVLRYEDGRAPKVLVDVQKELYALLEERLPEDQSADEFIEAMEAIEEERETLLAETAGILEGYERTRLYLLERGIALDASITAGEAATGTLIDEITNSRNEAMRQGVKRVEKIVDRQFAERQRLIGGVEAIEAMNQRLAALELRGAALAEHGHGVVMGIKIKPQGGHGGPSARRR